MKNNESQTTSTGEFKNRFSIRSIVTTVFMILLITIVVLWNPIDYRSKRPPQPTPNSSLVSTVVNAQNLPTATPTTDITEYREQTNGIVLGSVIMVLIVVGGTLSVIQRKS